MRARRTLAVFFGSTAAAMGLAVGGNGLLGSLLAPPGPPRELPVRASTRPTDPPRERAPRRTRGAWVEGITARNIFDHGAIGKASADETETESDLDVRVAGTLVAVPARFSSALIAVSKGAARSYNIGDRVLDAEIVEILPRVVVVRRPDGKLETLAMKPPERSAPRGRRAPAGTEDELITKVGAHHYIVDRSLIDGYLSDPGRAASLGRARVHRSGGQIDGYRLHGIRGNSPGYKLGIRTGDVVHAVNGKPLTSMAEAMAAYQELQRERRFSIELTRRGQKRTLTYDVR